MSEDSVKKTESLDSQKAEAGVAPTQPAVQLIRRRREFPRSATWLMRLAIPLLILFIAGFFLWRSWRPPQVTEIQPKLTTITETIASSGRVGGATETLVGAQAQGVIEQLKVKEGDMVMAGQTLATVTSAVNWKSSIVSVIRFFSVCMLAQSMNRSGVRRPAYPQN